MKTKTILIIFTVLMLLIKRMWAKATPRQIQPPMAEASTMIAETQAAMPTEYSHPAHTRLHRYTSTTQPNHSTHTTVPVPSPRH